jgi:hypothetical protein
MVKFLGPEIPDRREQTNRQRTRPLPLLYRSSALFIIVDDPLDDAPWWFRNIEQPFLCLSTGTHHWLVGYRQHITDVWLCRPWFFDAGNSHPREYYLEIISCAYSSSNTS